jgi:hypothetical protein
MKKQYIKPEMRVQTVDVPNVICIGSDPTPKGGGHGDARAREVVGVDWDDWEE